ncbi:MAG TPA: TVP38/TMEM64 family protein [Desulfomicrobiaceae bacterium]|nr:TVP38/TMEM64 family protein [Desulfomicrobiaceae bacterium]
MQRISIQKILLGTTIILGIVLFFILDLDRFLTLSYLKTSQTEFQTLFAAHPFAVIAAYFLLYIIIVAASLPGAAVISLAGGAMFGFWIGTLVVSFASSIGATLAAFLARYLFRGPVERNFGDRLTLVNEGIRREGAFYLFTMRLIPAIPFFIINVVMGLSAMPLKKFYWVSQLGMLPGTMVFLNAGSELGRIDSLGDILSPGLLFSFALLGIFPLATKKAMEFYRKKIRT